MKERAKNIISESLSVKQELLNSSDLLDVLQSCVELLVATFRNGGKVLFCGNGGSAADAQHLAAELSGRFYKERKPLFAEVLHGNSSFVTAVANDYGYEEVFARGVEAQGRPGDVLIVLSTSGKSPNILRAAAKARELGLRVIGMSGQSAGELPDCCDYLLKCPSENTPRIQECHILLGHIMCQLIEEELFS
ncbi:MAG: D-sedoheptulose 7-phosphate isomerase [Saprospiraceae bacterium]|jgi:D-sedoheptulose 7-phosphate isomerase